MFYYHSDAIPEGFRRRLKKASASAVALAQADGGRRKTEIELLVARF